MEIFNSVFGTLASISIMSFLACLGTSLGIGIFITFMYSRHARSSKSFMATLALLPSVVCVVILLVNGNIGAGFRLIYGVFIIRKIAYDINASGFTGSFFHIYQQFIIFDLLIRDIACQGYIFTIFIKHRFR